MPVREPLTLPVRSMHTLSVEEIEKQLLNLRAWCDYADKTLQVYISEQAQPIIEEIQSYIGDRERLLKYTYEQIQRFDEKKVAMSTSSNMQQVSVILSGMDNAIAGVMGGGESGISYRSTMPPEFALPTRAPKVR